MSSEHIYKSRSRVGAIARSLLAAKLDETALSSSLLTSSIYHPTLPLTIDHTYVIGSRDFCGFTRDNAGRRSIWSSECLSQRDDLPAFRALSSIARPRVQVADSKMHDWTDISHGNRRRCCCRSYQLGQFPECHRSILYSR